jgi:hypothetical protein
MGNLTLLAFTPDGLSGNCEDREWICRRTNKARTRRVVCIAVTPSHPYRLGQDRQVEENEVEARVVFIYLGI